MRAPPNPLIPFLEQQSVVVLDGGLATEVEARGDRLDDPLWSARLLLDAPERVVEVHEAYLAAGADCLITASYQATPQRLAAVRRLTADRAQRLLTRSVDLAREARQRFWRDPENRPGRLRPLVAASIGPYGAYLADGSEYTGRYDLDEEGLVAFHRSRFETLAASGADLLACETVPHAAEARALARLLQASPQSMPAWLSFSCPDGRRLADGSELEPIVREVQSLERIVALGVNCCAPRAVPGLLERLRRATDKPLVVYPNSGERFDATASAWRPADRPLDLAAAARRWFGAGARLIGGCCRVGPEDVRVIRQALL